MLKKTLAAFLSVLLIFLCIQPCFARGPTISIGAAAGMQGETVSVPIRISENPGINTFSLGIKYDQSKLTLIDVTPSSNLGGQFIYKKKAVWLNSKDIRYNGDILYLKFRIKDTASSVDTEVSVTYSLGDISNYNEQDITFTTSSGFVLIGIEKELLDHLKSTLDYMIKKLKAYSL